MAVFVGISRSLSFLNLQPGASNFWCVSGASLIAQPDDQILLYFPVANSQRVNGIAQVYRIVSEPQRTHRSPCANRGMAHVDTELVANLAERITAKDMKADPVVSRWSALSRSFQGVTFVVQPEIWCGLRGLIVARNPGTDGILAPADVPSSAPA